MLADADGRTLQRPYAIELQGPITLTADVPVSKCLVWAA